MLRGENMAKHSKLQIVPIFIFSGDADNGTKHCVDKHGCNSPVYICHNTGNVHIRQEKVVQYILNSYYNSN